MPYGFKASKTGMDINLKKAPAQEESSSTEDFRGSMVGLLALTYLRGAKIQLGRYKEAASVLKRNAVEGVILCLHETSCLFEDLATISIYMKILEETHEDRDLFIAIRDHIRHDVRENLDKEDEIRKIRRLKELSVKENLQMDIHFDLDYIQIGETRITLDQIEEYLRWVSSVFDKIFEEGRQKGYIKVDDNTKSKKK